MPRAEFLIDTSALSRAGKPAVSAELARLAIRGAIAVSAPVTFEMGFSARSVADRDRIIEGLAEFDQVETVEADQRRALEVQGQLAVTSRHRGLSLVDALVAAAAERSGLTVLHYDGDFERIAEVTGQDHRWVAARGAAD